MNEESFFDAKRSNARKHADKKQFKQEYKNKSKFSEKVNIAKQASKIRIAKANKLPSNWDKYEEEDDLTSEPHNSSALDFNSIPAMSSDCNRFQFKQEKIFMPSDQDSNMLEGFFELDLNLVNLGLLTVPFYERNGIEKHYFTENEITEMDQAAEKNIAPFEHYLKKNFVTNLNESAISKTSNLEVDQCKTEVMKPLRNRIESVDVITEELEEWLDNIL